ncbi:DUF2332 domain-containing protein [Paracoccus indicus]|uniref:DUF2332 domain-containing protein n=1 Tax=Paracoccus indicus TaxID=2079229 RepID=UPI000D349B7D|nr:DUF2332 domain-containing protein [Paracoccus indicus]
MTVRAAFRDQAQSCRQLGSPLTAALCEAFARLLDTSQGAVAQRILAWPGDPSSRADSVPLRLCGALHALVLTGADTQLAQAYAARDVPDALLIDVLQRHADHILNWLESPPQTNEVGRSAALIAAARFLSERAPRPLHLRELGASAGLNLNFDRYHLGPRDHGVALTPDWQGSVPDGQFTIASRRGVDLNPLHPERDGLRLMAYCWADQTARLARLRAALELARTDPPPVDRGDAGAWLGEQLQTPAEGTLLIFHTVAAQYFPPATTAACATALTTAGAQASPDRAIAHLQMEADGGEGAGLTLTLWDGRRRDWSLGRADFHGRWVRWSPERI